ncbi:MAG: RsmE family RNA methyltransferase [Patescibacteria group bacterium]
MKTHRFIGNFDFKNKEIELTDRELINQLKNVLRLEVGAEILIGNGKGEEARVKIKSTEREKVNLEIIEVRPIASEPTRKVKLFCAILKKENFELAVQKATEIGVSEITPVITERTVKTGLNYERLNKIIKEAAEQAGRGILPKLNETLNFEKALQTEAGPKILFHPSGEHLAPVVDEQISVFIGPEGGFTENEVELAKQNSAQIATFGPLIFRAETAAIIASYLAARV